MYLDHTFGHRLLLSLFAGWKLWTWTEVSTQRKAQLNQITFWLKYVLRLPYFCSGNWLS